MKLNPTPQETQKKTARAVLVVDADLRVADEIRHHAANPALEFRAAGSPDEAMNELRRRPADVVLVNLQIADNQGADLLLRIAKTFPNAETIAVTRSLRFDACLAAFRAGAKDVITIPLDAAAAQTSVHSAIERSEDRARQAKRQVRLRRVCKQLNKARHEISQQVDLLCQDLVTAYRQLAEKVHDGKQVEEMQAVDAPAGLTPSRGRPPAKPEVPAQPQDEFDAMIENDLDAESLLRKTMEYILKKVGPVNAAAFLPNSEGDFALGAYLNYDTASNSLLVDLVSQTIVKAAGATREVLNLATDKEINAALGAEHQMLQGRHWVALGAFHEDECLGALVIFRGQNELLNRSAQSVLETISPRLAAQIARVLAVHNRGFEADDELGDFQES